MPSPYVIPEPKSTPYQYIGEPPELGSLSLTLLARSFEELEKSDLSDLFPDQINNERTIIIETEVEGIGVMELVRPGIPNGATLENTRLFRRIVEPAFFRANDFIDQYLVNQLRKPGTYNDQNPPAQIVQERIRRMVNRHTRLKDWLRIQCLLGGISYTDPRTNVGINVSTQIPQHNFFRYDGWDATLAANATVSMGGSTYTANTSLTNNVNRKEALHFTSSSQKFGVPWTEPSADLVRCLRYIKQYLKNTNKNVFTDMYLSSDLYTVLLENNYIKAYMGAVGTFNYDASSSSKGMQLSGGANKSPFVSFGPGGDITQLAGLNIHVVDQLYRDPEDNNIYNMMPSNKVVLVAKTHVNDRLSSLGRTQHCSGEAIDGTPGLWVRTADPEHSAPPNLPGRAIQMGDAFLPFAMYPQWISVLDVCDTDDIESKLILRSDLNYMTY
jgi:hypothetical protein